jgi:hypothetical protein
MEEKHPELSSRNVRYGAFALGLATAIAVRILIILDHVEPAWVRPVWYFAVLGNFVFFMYRYRITVRRKKAVRRHRLIEKLSTHQALSDDDIRVLTYLLTSIKTSPENLNYLIISVFSILAIAVDLVFVYLGSR